MSKQMLIGSQVSSGIVAALHLYFLVLEMILWTTPYAQKAFRRSAAEQASTKVLAANQGLYNGFLAAGLIWTIITGDLDTRAFLLACIVIAGVYGGATASRVIYFAQAIPGAIALGFTLLAR